MMRRAKAGIGEAGTDRNDRHRGLVIANISSDLFEAAGRHERRDGVGDRAQAVHRHARGHTHHVGFRHAAIEEARRVLGLEFIEQAIADIPRQHDDAGVLVAEFGQFVCEGVSHARPSSLWALTTSSAVGAR